MSASGKFTSKEAAKEAKEPDGDSNGSLVATNASSLCILCLPARDEADEIAGTMLAQLSAMSGCVVEAVSVTSLASEMVELVEQRKADVVCISAMPPAAATHARYLCKRLQGRFPDAHLIVGLWNAKGDLTKMKERIGCGADNSCRRNPGGRSRKDPRPPPAACASNRAARGRSCPSTSRTGRRSMKGNAATSAFLMTFR